MTTSITDLTSRYRCQELFQKGLFVPIPPEKIVKDVFPVTQAHRDKLMEYEKEQQAYEEATYRYAQEHAAKIYAQVEVDGKVVATVYDNGVTCSSYDGSKILGTDGSAGLDVAKARLDEITRQTNGKIRYSKFDQNAYGVGGIYATIPGSFPRPTRSLGDILDEIREDQMRSRIAAAAEKVG